MAKDRCGKPKAEDAIARDNQEQMGKAFEKTELPAFGAEQRLPVDKPKAIDAFIRNAARWQFGKIPEAQAGSNQEDNDKPNGGYIPFAGLNPADFPEYIDGKQTVDDSSNDVNDKETLEGEPADKAISEPVMQKQQPSVKVTPFEQIVTPKVGIQNSAASRQDKSVQTLNKAINAIKKYGDLLRQLDQRGFSIDDAKSFVETENIGFSIHKMLTNKETFDSIADVVTALNPS